MDWFLLIAREHSRTTRKDNTQSTKKALKSIEALKRKWTPRHQTRIGSSHHAETWETEALVGKSSKVVKSRNPAEYYSCPGTSKVPIPELAHSSKGLTGTPHPLQIECKDANSARRLLRLLNFLCFVLSACYFVQISSCSGSFLILSFFLSVFLSSFPSFFLPSFLPSLLPSFLPSLPPSFPPSFPPSLLPSFLSFRLSVCLSFFLPAPLLLQPTSKFFGPPLLDTGSAYKNAASKEARPSFGDGSFNLEPGPPCSEQLSLVQHDQPRYVGAMTPMTHPHSPPPATRRSRRRFQRRHMPRVICRRPTSQGSTPGTGEEKGLVEKRHRPREAQGGFDWFLPKRIQGSCMLLGARTLLGTRASLLGTNGITTRSILATSNEKPLVAKGISTHRVTSMQKTQACQCESLLQKCH